MRLILVNRIIAIGALIFLARSLAAQNLVSNPGFETGSFSSWTLSGAPNRNITSVFPSPHSGNFAAGFFSDSTYSFISQNLQTTPGVAYTIDYFLARAQVIGEPSGVPTRDFAVFWGGVEILSLHIGSTLSSADFGYAYFASQPMLATASLTELRFGFRMPNAANEWVFDDVGVVPTVPEHASTLGMLIISLVAFFFLGRARSVGRLDRR